MSTSLLLFPVSSSMRVEVCPIIDLTKGQTAAYEQARVMELRVRLYWRPQPAESSLLPHDPVLRGVRAHCHCRCPCTVVAPFELIVVQVQSATRASRSCTVDTGYCATCAMKRLWLQASAVCSRRNALNSLRWRGTELAGYCADCTVYLFKFKGVHSCSTVVRDVFCRQRRSSVWYFSIITVLSWVIYLASVVIWTQFLKVYDAIALVLSLFKTVSVRSKTLALTQFLLY